MFGVMFNYPTLTRVDENGNLIQVVGLGNANKLEFTIANSQNNLILEEHILQDFPDISNYTEIEVTIPSGVTIGSTATSYPALKTGTFSTFTGTLTLINNGIIVGAGGDGGDGTNDGTVGNDGGAGGTAILLDYDLTLTNNNLIGGGGGGGASEEGFSRISAKKRVYSPGGGGAGSVPGKGGTSIGLQLTSGEIASNGNLRVGGEGRENGGAGGNLGAAGGNSGDASGGAAGTAIDQNGNTVTTTNNGTISGATIV